VEEEEEEGMVEVEEVEEEGMCWEGGRLEELECRFAGPSEVRARLQLLVARMAAAVLTVAAGRALGQQGEELDRSHVSLQESLAAA